MVGTVILWILKIILWILLGLVALVLIALQIPAGVRFQYEAGSLCLAVRYGPVNLQILPKKEKAEKPPKKEKTKRSRKEKSKKEKPKKSKAKINREQIFYALENLPPILGRALKRTGKSIRIKPLKLYILVAGTDPADTAQLYSRLSAALSAGYSALEKTLRLKDADIRVYVDFQEVQMDFIVDAGVSLRPGSLVWMGLRAGGSLLRWYLGFRKLASPVPKLDEKQETTEQSDVDKENEAA